MVKSSEGTSELLRRVPVISLEDTLMHPALPLVVWLMAAQVTGGGGRSCDWSDQCPFPHSRLWRLVMPLGLYSEWKQLVAERKPRLSHVRSLALHVFHVAAEQGLHAGCPACDGRAAHGLLTSNSTGR